MDLTQKVPDTVQRSLLATSPDIVISTPARAALSVSNSSYSVDNMSLLVIDEADLVLSYGYEEDLQNLAKSIPHGVQTMLMSATLTTEVDMLKNLYCRDPVVFELENQDGNDGGLTQYVVRYGYSLESLKCPIADPLPGALKTRNFSFRSSSSN